MDTLSSNLKNILGPRRMRKKMFKRIGLILVICCSFKGFGQTEAGFGTIISQWAGQELLRHATVGIQMEDAATGEILGSFNPDLSMAPASTLKLFTTATALEMMGPDYRFKTRLAFHGIIRNDSLQGDLIIVGGGDPALGSEYFREHYLKDHFLSAWIDSLKQYNIRHISGDLITDATVYDDRTIPDTWSWEDLGNYYGAGVSGLSVYDNTCEIHLYSPSEAGKLTRVISTNPTATGLNFTNRVLSSDDPRDLAFVFGSPLDSAREIRGTVPRGKKDFVIRASVPDPERLLARQFRQMMESQGITVGGKIRAASTKSANWVSLATTCSPTLADLIRVTNHESVNLFAEHFLKHLAYLKTGLGTTKEGIRIVTDFWKSKGIDTRGLLMCDGSGLSRFNVLTGSQMVRMLSYMKNKSPHSDIFFSSLPAVPDGTLSYFNARNFPNKSLRTKSGSMTRVRCYAGLIRTKSGREILFNISLNNFSCSHSQAVNAIEALLISLYGL